MDEDSLKERRDRYKGALLHQLEFVKVVSAKPLSLPEKRRLHFPGSNRGDMMGPVALPAMTDLWTVSWKDKKAMLGKHARIRCGGGLQAPAAPDTGKDFKPRTDADVDPFMYHGMTPEVWESILDAHCVEAVFAGSASDGALILACIRRKIPVAVASAGWSRKVLGG